MLGTPQILFAAGREDSYVRNQTMLRALHSLSQVRSITPAQPGSLTSNVLRIIPRLITALKQPYDLVILGFYSHPLVPIVRKFTRAPILFDAFVSTWDTLSFDRALFPPYSIRGRIARQLDIVASHSAQRVLLDTDTQAQYFSKTFNVAPTKIDHWYVGCDETIFLPASDHPDVTTDRVTVLFYGTYQPLHGVEQIVEAAALLRDKPRIRFKLIGDGQTFDKTRQIALDQNLSNVEFHPAVPIKTLAAMIAQSDICLAGPFGNTEKSGRVIPGKTSQFLAMARPTIASHTAANHELLVHGASAYLCKQADPIALADAIQHLAFDLPLRKRIAAGGRRLFEKRLSLSRLTADLSQIIDKMIQTSVQSTASNRSTHTSH